MKTTRDPALVLAQSTGNAAPVNAWGVITRWVVDCGYVGVRAPSSSESLKLLNHVLSKSYYS